MAEAQNVGLLLQQGVEALHAGRPDDAEQTFRRVMIAQPDSGDAHHLLGAIAMERKQRDLTFEHLRKAVELNPESAIYHNSLAVACVRDGQRTVAVRHFWRAISIQPDYFDALKNLVIALREAGEFQETTRLADRALQFQPDSAELLFNRARAIHSMGRTDEAIDGYRKALQAEAAHVPTLTEMGFVHLDREEPEEALPYFEQAVELAPGNIRGLDGLGHVYEQQHDMVHAIATWERALGVHPDAPVVLTSLGITCVQVGRIDEGRERLRRAIQVAPLNAEAHLALSQSGTITADDPEIVRLESLVTRDGIAPEDRARMHFALGKSYEDNQQYEAAFGQYSEGNRLKRELMDYDAAHATQQFNSLISFFSSERLESLAGRFAAPSDRPIFVVGLPRSGTTLVEQIIASHPSVFGAGELPYLERMVQQLPTKMSQKVTFPWCIEQLPAEMGSALAQEYVERLRTLSPDHPRVIDKMPKNAFYIGLIRMLWPQALIVLCSRDLMDVAVSCYTRYFAKGQPFSWDLSELGMYCRGHECMARHWLDVARPAIIEVRYEELTSNQEAVTRQLIDFLGLSWNDACLSFHDTTRRIKTNPLSVRQPIYSSSVARWKRFEPWLGTLTDTLADG